MIQVLLHRILIKQDKLENANKDYVKMRELGLVLAQGEDSKRAQAGVDTGTVEAIGGTAFRDFGTESPIQIGDHIAYARFAGKFITDPETGEEFVALNDEDVVCVFRSE